MKNEKEIIELVKEGKNSSQISSELNLPKLDVDLFLAEKHYDRIMLGNKRNVISFTKSQFLQAISDIYFGKTSEVACADLGLKKTSLCYHFRRAGIDHVTIFKPKKLSPEETNNIMSDFYNGIPVYKLVKKYNYSKNCLAKFIRKHGGDPTKPTCNINVFSKINSHEKAYWLGFLYADGSVDESKKSVELALKLADLEHVLKFKNFTSSETKISLRKIHATYNNSIHHACRIAVYHQQIYEDLCKLGCPPKKSLILKFPTEDQVPRQYIYSFICGYFDGDGCLSYTGCNTKGIVRPHVTIVGTKDFLEGIIKSFPNLDYRLSKDRNIYVLAIKARSIANFLDTIYLSPIHLNRKYSRYLIFKNNKFAVQKSDLLDNDRVISEKSKDFVNNYYNKQIL